MTRSGDVGFNLRSKGFQSECAIRTRPADTFLLARCPVKAIARVIIGDFFAFGGRVTGEGHDNLGESSPFPVG